MEARIHYRFLRHSEVLYHEIALELVCLYSNMCLTLLLVIVNNSREETTYCRGEVMMIQYQLNFATPLRKAVLTVQRRHLELGQRRGE